MADEGEVVLPTCSSGDSLANELSNVFIRQTAKIRNTVHTDNASMNETILMEADVAFQEQRLTELRPSTQDVVRDIITKSPPKSCGLNPLPTCLLKQLLEHVLLRRYYA